MADGQLAMRAGALVLVREAAGDDAVALAAEWSALERLVGLAVPEVLSWELDGERRRLTTSFGPPAPALTTSTLLVVAEVVAAAHARGVVHGALDASCVRVDGSQVLVAGWGTGGAPPDDVAALGRMLAGIAQRDDLAATARRAIADDPSTRPTMAALAEALAAPPPRSVSSVGASRTHGRQRTGAVVALIALTLGGVAVLARHPSTPVRSGSTSAPATGNVVEHDGVAVRIGRDGDVAVIGDWDCDGTTTPAVLRPSARVVWRWDDWDGRPTATRASIGAASLRVEPGGACDRLVELDAEGAELTD